MTDATIGRVQVLWEKLQRRKVVQWGIAYCLFAWGLLQGLEYLSSTFGWPQLLQQLATLASLIGLPIVLVVAWYHGDRGEQQINAAEFLILFGLLLLGGALFWWYGASSVTRTAHQDESSATTPAPERSIAVLPFDNLGSEATDKYLGDGLAEELANLLTRVPDLEVASRTSAFSFKDRKMAICEIAAELGVRYLVEGSLRRNGDTLSITAQLIECPRGTHAWSNTYRRPLAELPDVERDIAGSVVEALKIVLAPEAREQMQRRDAANRDAYEPYRQGVSELRNYTDPSSLDLAVQRFEAAIAADPTFSAAHAGLCEALVQRYTKLETVADVASAERACEQAVRLDRGLPEVHTALGMLYLATGQREHAERDYRRAIELDPENVDAQLGLGAALTSRGDAAGADLAYREALRLRSRYWRVYDAYGGFLYQQGRLPEAIAQFRRGVELSPQNATLLSNLGGVLVLNGDFAAAADAFRRSVDIAPTSAAYSNTGTNYYYAGRYQDAVAMFEQATRLAPEDYQVWGNLGDAYRRLPGREEAARGAYARAADLARAGLRVNPDSVTTRTVLAYYLVRLGDRSGAERELASALAADGRDLYSHYFAALVYKALGDAGAAGNEARAALEDGFPAVLLKAEPELADLVTERRPPTTGSSSAPD